MLQRCNENGEWEWIDDKLHPDYPVPTAHRDEPHICVSKWRFQEPNFKKKRWNGATGWRCILLVKVPGTINTMLNIGEYCTQVWTNLQQSLFWSHLSFNVAMFGDMPVNPLGTTSVNNDLNNINWLEERDLSPIFYSQTVLFSFSIGVPQGPLRLPEAS